MLITHQMEVIKAVCDRVAVMEAGRVLESGSVLERAQLDEQTSAYRLLYGEGDGIPGLTVDVYGAFAVIVTYADSLETVVPWVIGVGLSIIVFVAGSTSSAKALSTSPTP